MSREIKFRAWDKEEKIMCPVEVMNLEKGCFLMGNSPTPTEVGDGYIRDAVEEGHFVYFTDLELMQWTGLKDKNGKEIYEGDILTFAEHDYENKANWVIEYRAAGFVGIACEKNLNVYRYQLDNRNYLQFIVIGNIYENENLLHGK